MAAKSKYTVKVETNKFFGIDYIGYIDDKYAGYIKGYMRTKDTIDIQFSYLEQQFRGTKAVRAVKEITTEMQKDFKNIITRIDSKNNSSLKIALSCGFNIIGTTTYNGNIAVELLKTKEKDNGQKS